MTYVGAINLQFNILMIDNMYQCISMVKLTDSEEVGKSPSRLRVIGYLAIGRSPNRSKVIEYLASGKS